VHELVRGEPRDPEDSYQVLVTLLKRPGEVVSREDLRSTLWRKDTFVDFESGVKVEAVEEEWKGPTPLGEASPCGGASRYGLFLPSVYMHRALERLGHTPPSSSPTRMLH